MCEVLPAYETIPRLAIEWQQDTAATMEKFQQFIQFHAVKGQYCTSTLYRCALVQLIHGYGVQHINGLGFDESRLRLETGT